jgi:hypothetical protein
MTAYGHTLLDREFVDVGSQWAGGEVLLPEARREFSDAAGWMFTDPLLPSHRSLQLLKNRRILSRCSRYEEERLVVTAYAASGISAGECNRIGVGACVGRQLNRRNNLSKMK